MHYVSVNFNDNQINSKYIILSLRTSGIVAICSLIVCLDNLKQF